MPYTRLKNQAPRANTRESWTQALARASFHLPSRGQAGTNRMSFFSRPIFRWSMLAAAWGLPYILVLMAGWAWLWEHGLLGWWLGVALSLLIIGRGVHYWLTHRTLPVPQAQVRGSAQWHAAGERAWKSIGELSERIAREPEPIYSADRWWNLLQAVLETVAREFHPESKQAVLEAPVTHVLKIVELVAQDLRRDITANVPGAHLLTMHEAVKLKNMAVSGKQFYDKYYSVYRVGHALLNPFTALFREVRDYVAGDLMNQWGGEAQRWVVDYCIKKAGYYAIELYSGNLVLDPERFEGYSSPQSKQDSVRHETREVETAQEPLRVMVIGQVKAGKSSLINALFGEMKAAVDVLPATRQIEPYLLERDGVGRAIIIDTAGYSDVAANARPWAPLEREIKSVDLFLLVCSATSAARAADRQRLDEIREVFRADARRSMPPVLAVLTHIDQLRPVREWNPPYNLTDPAPQTKARQIVDAAEAVAADLGLDSSHVVPVCLEKPAEPYNVEEGLIPAMVDVLPQAQRAKYLRCLKQFHTEEYWRLAREQAVSAGRLLSAAAKFAAGKLGDALQDLSKGGERK